MFSLKFISFFSFLINSPDDGYKLTYLGYDYLALYAFIKRGQIKSILGKMGVGKESDIYRCLSPSNEVVVLKLARFGLTRFSPDFSQAGKNFLPNDKEKQGLPPEQNQLQLALPLAFIKPQRVLLYADPSFERFPDPEAHRFQPSRDSDVLY